MNISSLTQTYRSMQRVRKIVTVLSRHGFSRLMARIGLGRFLPLGQRVASGGVDAGLLPAPVQLRLAMEELGPTFVKLGQMLSARPDLIPEEFAREFESLRDDVRPFDFDKVREIVEEEVGAPFDEVFDEVDPKPLAAASIAQVHAGRLGDGAKVALKVKRPGIDKVVAQDISTLYLFVSLAEHYLPESRKLHLGDIVDEFDRTIKKELDFFREGANTERVRKNFEGFEGLSIPTVHWELTSRALLVVDRVDGVSLSDPDGMRENGVDPTDTARIVARMFLKQVLEDGLFHGDPHGGNLLAKPGGGVSLIDFGAVGYLSEDMREGLGELFLALLARDYEGMAEIYITMGRGDELQDQRGFMRDLRDLVEPYHGRPVGDLRIGEILTEVATIALKHRLRLDPELILLGRASLVVEGLIRSLDPTIVLLDEALVFAKKLLVSRFDPRKRSRDFVRAARGLGDFLAKAPGQLSRILQKLIDGRISIDFVHKGYDPLIDEMDRSSNRISFALIISALIVGSALIVLSGKGPQLWNFPVLGIIGFVLAGVMGFGLAVAILRSGKL